MSTLFPDLLAFGTVVVIDLTLAGDNALVIGMLAAGLPAEQRARVIAIGIGFAMVTRILFAVVATQLMAVVGLLLAGGLLLLWVAWKMWREMPGLAVAAECTAAVSDRRLAKTVRAGIWQICVADISMSLDNILAVAGAARHNVWILVFGLVLSVVVMGAAAGFVARFAVRYPWLNLVGILVVAAVALTMIYEGGEQVLAAT